MTDSDDNDNANSKKKLRVRAHTFNHFDWFKSKVINYIGHQAKGQGQGQKLDLVKTDWLCARTLNFLALLMTLVIYFSSQWRD